MVGAGRARPSPPDRIDEAGEEVYAMRTIESRDGGAGAAAVLSTVLLMPLLGFFAESCRSSAAALAGCARHPPSPSSSASASLPLTDLWQLLIKAPVFGLIIAWRDASRLQSNRSRGGRAADHHRVVQGIFLVIVLDASSRLLHRDRLGRAAPRQPNARAAARGARDVIFATAPQQLRRANRHEVSISR